MIVLTDHFAESFTCEIRGNDDDVTTTISQKSMFGKPLLLKVSKPYHPFSKGPLVYWKNEEETVPLISGRHIEAKEIIPHIPICKSDLVGLHRNQEYKPNRGVIEIYSQNSPDTCSSAGSIFRILSEALNVTPPSVDHNKITTKLYKKTALSELHIDIFPDIGRDLQGKLTRIWRTFINLQEEPRTTFVCLHDPNIIDTLATSEDSPGHVEFLANHNNHEFQGVILTIPGANLNTGEFFGYEVLTTHLVHGEYGRDQDMVAIINSLEPHTF